MSIYCGGRKAVERDAYKTCEPGRVFRFPSYPSCVSTVRGKVQRDRFVSFDGRVKRLEIEGTDGDQGFRRIV